MVEHEDGAGRVLGVQIDGDTLHDQFAAATHATDQLCDALAQIDDAPAEMAYLRMSLSLWRAVHLLRAAGPLDFKQSGLRMDFSVFSFRMKMDT